MTRLNSSIKEECDKQMLDRLHEIKKRMEILCSSYDLEQEVLESVKKNDDEIVCS